MGLSPVGVVTRGTTGRRRLRRVDTWLTAMVGPLLTVEAAPLVVDLGYGASPVTTVELRRRLATTVGNQVRVVGLEIEPARVATAAPAADPPWLEFRVGGFELAGLRPHVVRAMNVLRQYPESAVAAAWGAMRAGLARGGVIVEGTCDEGGHLASWVCLSGDGPRTFTMAADLSRLDSPLALAARLPKALIHRNVPGEPVHDLLESLERGWRDAAGLGQFGAGQRWHQAVAAVRAGGWPVMGGPTRWRRGEITVRWRAVAPREHDR